MIVSNLTGGVTYYFVATAYDSALVEGPPSNEASFFASTNPTPVLAVVSSQYVNAMNVLIVTNHASDPTAPTKKLTYSLDPGAPNFMRINPTNGLLMWLAPFSAAGTTIPVTVRVTDNSVPPMSATQGFNVAVGHASELSVGAAAVSAGQSGTVPLTLASSIGVTNVLFILDFPNNQVSSVTVSSLAPSVATVTQSPVGSTHSTVTVKAVSGQVLQNLALVQVNFTAKANQHSSFVPVTVSGMNAVEVGGTPVPKSIGLSGRIVLIGPEPIVSAQLSTNGLPSIVVYGNSGANFAVDMKTNARVAGGWTTVTTGVLTNGVQTVTNITATGRLVLFRARTF
jgi:hypothetical protein